MRRGYGGHIYTSDRRRDFRAALAVAVALVALACACLAAPPASAASRQPVEPAFGRWVGTGRQGERVAFVVRSWRGYRVIGSPSFACKVLPVLPGQTYIGYSLGSLDDDAVGSTGPLPPAVVAPIRRSGSFGYPDTYYVHNAPLEPTLRDNDMYGRLSTDSGWVRIPGWSSPCEADTIRVRHISDTVRANGVYLGFGSYLTHVAAQVRSGGSLVSFLTQGGTLDTQWGGPPDPDISERLGPEAGLEACAAGFGPSNVPVFDSAGTVAAGGLFDFGALAPAAITVAGRFVTHASLAGTYVGYFSFDAQTDCPLDGLWAAHQISGPLGTRWPTGYRPQGANRPGCRVVKHIVRVHLSIGRVPEVIDHIKVAIEHGWPRIMILNRPGAGARRTKLLRRTRKEHGLDRDEYPPAILRGRGPGLERGSDPTGWEASVAYVPPRQNQSAGGTTAARLLSYCSGQRVEYTW